MDGDNRPDKRRLRETRDGVIGRLTESFAKDEVGLQEFEERIDRAYRAASPEELLVLVRDLGAPLAVPTNEGAAPVIDAVLVEESRALAPVRSRNLGRAILGSVERTGRLPVEGHSVAEAYLGSLVIDLRDAKLRPGVTELRLRAVFGSIEVFVPADVSVECEGMGILGSFEGKTRVVAEDDAAGAAERPVLRIVGAAVFGSIEVRTKVPSTIEREVQRLRAGRLLPR